MEILPFTGMSEAAPRVAAAIATANIASVVFIFFLRSLLFILSIIPADIAVFAITYG